MNAKDMFYPEGKQFSNAEERAYAREELVYNVTEDLLILLEDMEVSKKELACRLGKSKSFVSQVLSGARNMTLGSLSDICYALDVKPKIILPVQEEQLQETEKLGHWETVSVECTEKPAATLIVSNKKIIEFPKENTRWNERVA